MRKTLKTAAIACAAGVAIAGTAGAAGAAMRGGHIGMGMGHPPVAHIAHYGHGWGYHHHHHFYPGFVFGVWDDYYPGDYDYGGCGYYRVRWHETGSRYWRARYLDCREG